MEQGAVKARESEDDHIEDMRSMEIMDKLSMVLSRGCLSSSDCASQHWRTAETLANLHSAAFAVLSRTQLTMGLSMD